MSDMTEKLLLSYTPKNIAILPSLKLLMTTSNEENIIFSHSYDVIMTNIVKNIFYYPVKKKIGTYYRIFIIIYNMLILHPK